MTLSDSILFHSRMNVFWGGFLIENFFILLPLLRLFFLIEQEIVKDKRNPPRQTSQLNFLLFNIITSSRAKQTRGALIMKCPKNEISIRSQLNEVFFSFSPLVCSFIVHAFNTEHESSCFIQIEANGPVIKAITKVHPRPISLALEFSTHTWTHMISTN